MSLAGDTMTGSLSMGGNLLRGVADPAAVTDSANKQYVDSRIWTGTQAQYDAIASPDPSILYCII